MSTDWNAAKKALEALQQATEQAEADGAAAAQAQAKHAQSQAGASVARQSLNQILDSK
jgi:hypothetical protein